MNVCPCNSWSREGGLTFCRLTTTGVPFGTRMPDTTVSRVAFRNAEGDGTFKRRISAANAAAMGLRDNTCTLQPLTH